jgi:HK97 gp10 family phage protein
VTIQVTGVAELKRKLRSLGASMEDAIFGGVILTANEIRTDAIKSIQNKSGGAQVSRSRQGGGTYTHTASAAGGAPNTDTGKLVASIAVEPNKSGVYALVGSNLDYGGFLEFGTSKMGARPWLEPALRKNKDNLQRNINAAANTLIERKSK